MTHTSSSGTDGATGDCELRVHRGRPSALHTALCFCMCALLTLIDG